MKYNRTLDYAALAIIAMRRGRTTQALSLLRKAADEPDCKQALKIIATANEKAFLDEEANAAALAQETINKAMGV